MSTRTGRDPDSAGGRRVQQRSRARGLLAALREPQCTPATRRVLPVDRSVRHLGAAHEGLRSLLARGRTLDHQQRPREPYHSHALLILVLRLCVLRAVLCRIFLCAAVAPKIILHNAKRNSQQVFATWRAGIICADYTLASLSIERALAVCYPFWVSALIDFQFRKCLQQSRSILMCSPRAS